MVLAGTGSVASASPATKVTWLEHSRYKDILLDGMASVRRSFQVLSRAMDVEFEYHANKHLPPGSILYVTVLDFELAGSMEPVFASGRSHDRRVIREIYPPRMQVAYRLLDDEGNLLLEGEERFEDLDFLAHPHTERRIRHHPFERIMVEKWILQLASRLSSGNSG